MLYDLAVIGGGAAGLAASVAAARHGDHVIILEAGNAIGKKILASGNGRCNLMNTGELRYYGDSDFAGGIMKRCGAEVQKEFWKSIGLITVEESEYRVYPSTFQAASVLQVLKTALQLFHVNLSLNTYVNDCAKCPDQSFRIAAGGREVTARRVLVATGGPAGTKFSDQEPAGYQILRKFGHELVPLRPALVPLFADRKSISGLSGLRVRCSVRLFDSHHHLVFPEKGELLFTDTGISGICAMQCARFVDGPGYYIEADLAERLFPDDTELLSELRRRKKMFKFMTPETLLIGMLNAKLAYAVLKQAGIAMRGERLCDLDDTILRDIARSLRHYKIDILGTRGMEDAQVTAGGIDCREFRNDNLESRIVPGLHAAGEILNTDGDCGGFNLMFAFGTGLLAGENGRKPYYADNDFGKEGGF